MKKFLLSLLVLFLLGNFLSCNTYQRMKEREIKVHAHRGDRGSFPENSIPAFISAVKKGSDAIEMDVVISRDRKVVVSHEPYMASRYMLTPEGRPVGSGRSFKLFEMTYDSIREFDAGSKPDPGFPRQKNIRTYKPLLGEVIDKVESHVLERGWHPVTYNIEIKSDPRKYGVEFPYPEELVDLVLEVIRDKGIQARTLFQSFDPVILNILKAKQPELPVSLLVGVGESTDKLSRLDFIPEVYSPHYSILVGEDQVDYLQKMQMQVIPWTVNSRKDIRRMIRFGVDGIITDYPERVLRKL